MMKRMKYFTHCRVLAVLSDTAEVPNSERGSMTSTHSHTVPSQHSAVSRTDEGESALF